MPVYTVSDPKGREVEITGERLPTEGELAGIFAKAFPDSAKRQALESDLAATRRARRLGEIVEGAADLGGGLVSGLAPQNIPANLAQAARYVQTGFGKLIGTPPADMGATVSAIAENYGPYIEPFIPAADPESRKGIAKGIVEAGAGLVASAPEFIPAIAAGAAAGPAVALPVAADFSTDMIGQAAKMWTASKQAEVAGNTEESGRLKAQAGLTGLMALGIPGSAVAKPFFDAVTTRLAAKPDIATTLEQSGAPLTAQAVRETAKAPGVTPAPAPSVPAVARKPESTAAAQLPGAAAPAAPITPATTGLAESQATALSPELETIAQKVARSAGGLTQERLTPAEVAQLPKPGTPELAAYQQRVAELRKSQQPAASAKESLPVGLSGKVLINELTDAQILALAEDAGFRATPKDLVLESRRQSLVSRLQELEFKGLLDKRSITREPAAAAAQPETGYAEGVRSDTGQLEERGPLAQGIEADRRHDVEQAAPGQPEPVGEGGQVAPLQGSEHAPELAGGAQGEVRDQLAQSPEVAPTAPAAKEPWQMTAKQFRSSQVKGQPEYVVRNQANLALDFELHKELVQDALRESKPVPAEVLADYPDLKPTAQPAAPFDIEASGAEMGLTPEQIAQAKAEGVTSELGLRRIEKSTRQPAQPAAETGKAEAKIAAEVQQVARTEGQRPAKEVKAELIQRLEKAIEEAPSESDAGTVGERGKVTIDIPGDGVFTITKTKEALGLVLKRAKRLKTSPTEETKISAAQIRSSEKALGISEERRAERLRQEADAERKELIAPTEDALNKSQVEGPIGETERYDRPDADEGQQWKEVRIRLATEPERLEWWKGNKKEIRWVVETRSVKTDAAGTEERNEWGFHNAGRSRAIALRDFLEDAPMGFKAATPELERAMAIFEGPTSYAEWKSKQTAQAPTKPSLPPGPGTGVGPGSAAAADFPAAPPQARAAGARVEQAVPEARPQGPVHPATPLFTRIREGVATWLRGAAGDSMPKTTAADRRTGEAGVEYASARISAQPQARAFAASVLEGTDVDPVKLGAALTEDNLTSIRESFREAATRLALEGKEDEAATAAENADHVATIIGSRGSPFATQEEFFNYLRQPAVQEAIQKHIQLWQEVVDPMYREAQSIDPDVELPSRGQITGARINLKAVIEGEEPAVRPVAGSGGSLTATFKRKSPFGIRAKGTGQTYDVDYASIIQNTFARQLEIAKKNAFDRMLVESGNAAIDRPGQHITIAGEPTASFPIKRTRFVTSTGGFTKNEAIYVRKSLADEYRTAAGIDPRHRIPIVTPIANLLNKSALAGLTDFSVHLSNQMTALFNRPASARLLTDSLLSATGRADVPVTLFRAITKAFQDNEAQVAELAKIGAMRSDFTIGTGVFGFGKVLKQTDTLTRLVLDDTFKRLADAGLVENTSTARREYVNQIGQYNRRLQGPLTRFLRDTGFGPFVTAGKTFNALGVKMITLSPGANAANNYAALALRANVLSKFIGAGVLVGILNYLLTHDKGGGVSGRPGTPIGNVDFGTNDKSGKQLSYPLFGLLGLARGARVTGLRGAVEAKRMGLSNADAIDSAARDIINSWVAPAAGPPVKAAFIAASGYQPAINVGRASRVAPPGQSQLGQNVLEALKESNPVVVSIIKAYQGKSVPEILSSQLPRFSLVPGKTMDLVEKYPKIVSMAQGNAFIEDVIYQARRLPQDQKHAFINEQIARLPANQRKHAYDEVKRRKVMLPPRTTPRGEGLKAFREP